MKKHSYMALAASIVLGAAGCGVENPTFGPTAPVNQQAVTHSSVFAGTFGVVFQSTNAENDTPLGSSGNNTTQSSAGILVLNGAGYVTPATAFSNVVFDGTNTTVTTTTAAPSGTFQVNPDNKTFFISQALTNPIGGGSQAFLMAGLIANNQDFASGTVVDLVNDQGLAYLLRLPSQANNASLNGTYLLSLNNVGNGSQAAAGSLSFGGDGTVGGNLQFQDDSSDTLTDASSYTVSLNGAVSATFQLASGNVLSASGFVGQDGTLALIASDLAGASDLLLASTGPATATTADLSGALTLNLLTDNGNGTVSGDVQADGAGNFNSFSLTATSVGGDTNTFNASGTYQILSSGLLDPASILTEQDPGSGSFVFNNVFFNADKTYLMGTSFDGTTNDVLTLTP